MLLAPGAWPKGLQAIYDTVLTRLPVAAQTPITNPLPTPTAFFLLRPVPLRSCVPNVAYESQQMKQLELQQQLEEQQLLAASGDAKSTGNANGPIRSRSGNDLASFNTADSNEHGAAGGVHASSAAAKYAAAKSMPGSRRHSGEIKEQQQKKLANGIAAAAGQQKDADGKPMLNSFLFDDELDADLQSESQRYPREKRFVTETDLSSV